MRIGLIIKLYRESHSLSMEEFAKKANISKAYVGLLEKGMHPKTGNIIKPSIDIIRKVANGMGTDFDTLFRQLDEDVFIDNNKDNNNLPTALLSDEQLELVTKFESLSSAHQKMILENIAFLEAQESLSDDQKKVD